MKKLPMILAAVASLVPVAVAALPPAQAWEIGPWVRGRNYSVGMPARPSPVANGVGFEFPVAGRGQIDAMTTTIRPLAGARQITVRYRVDAAPGTRFIADERPGEPATVSLYFQRAGDNWSSRGAYGSFRWYVPSGAVIPLSPGTRTVTVRLDDGWTNVNGLPAAQDRAGFAAALAETQTIGLAFGSQSARSHGVYATGPARFVLLGLDIS